MMLSVVAAALLATGAPAAAATVRVEVSRVEAGVGAVFASLCAGGLEPASCPRGRREAATQGTVGFTFADIPEGDYAIAVFQDIDGDGSLARTPLGLPLEPYGFSNDAGRAVRPSFLDAAVAVREPGATIRVRLRRIPQRR